MSVWNSLSTLEKFIFTEWQYSNKQAMVMAKSMHEIDQKKFFIDISSLNWRDYFEHAILGVREYLNKDPLKTLPAARRKLKLYVFVFVCFFVFINYFIIYNEMIDFLLLVCWSFISSYNCFFILVCGSQL